MPEDLKFEGLPVGFRNNNDGGSAYGYIDEPRDNDAHFVKVSVSFFPDDVELTELERLALAPLLEALARWGHRVGKARQTV